MPTTAFTHSSPEPVSGLPKGADPVATGKTEGGELAPTLYYETEKRPYLAKHLEIENTYSKLPHDFQEYAEDIDDYFKDQVQRKKYENSPDSYKHFFKHYEKVTDSVDTPLQMKLMRIAEFLKYVKKTS